MPPTINDEVDEFYFDLYPAIREEKINLWKPRRRMSIIKLIVEKYKPQIPRTKIEALLAYY